MTTTHAPACSPGPGTASRCGDEPESITPQAAAAERWQVVVVGAGPAGAAAAITLARQGLRVLVVERGAARRPKVCGCCLSPLAVRELAGLDPGLGPSRAADDGAEVRWLALERVRLLAGGRAAAVALPAGAVLSREALDERLVRTACAAGCQWLPQSVVTTVQDDPGGVTLAVRRGRERVELAADACILATGLAGPVRVNAARPSAGGAVGTRRIAARSRIGCGTTLPATAIDLPAGELVMAVGRGGYCGVVRLEDGRIDVAAAVDPGRLQRGGVAAAVADILREAGGGAATLARAVAAAGFRTTPLLTGVRPLVAGPWRRILVVGDAAAYVEPFTGEGIGWALLAGRLAAESLAGDGSAGLRPPVAAAAAYETAHRRCFTTRHARCRRVAAAVRWPGLVTACAAVAGAVPATAGRCVPFVVGGPPAGGR